MVKNNQKYITYLLVLLDAIAVCGAYFLSWYLVFGRPNGLGGLPKEQYFKVIPFLVPAYLISILCGNESYEKNCVKEQCHITGIDSVFVDIDIGDLRRRLQNDIVEVGAEGVYDLLDFIDNT